MKKMGKVRKKSDCNRKGDILYIRWLKKKKNQAKTLNNASDQRQRNKKGTNHLCFILFRYS